MFSVLGTLNCNTYGSIDYDNGIVNISGTVNVNQEEGLYSVNDGVVNVLSTGAIHVNGGTMNIRGSGSIEAGGLLEINSGGRYDGYFGSFANSGTMVNGAGCLIHLEYGVINNSGTFTNNGNITHYTGAVTGTGLFNGTGVFSLGYTNASGGTLSPGNSPGCMSFDGSLVNNGTLEIELADGTACTNFDQIQVLNGHNATLGGTINITFPSGVPTTTTFTILTVTGGGTITSNSPTINWPAGYIGSGAVVGQTYQVTFSPAPTTYTFIGSGSWANSGNWQGGVIPPSNVSSSDSIIINGTGACDFNNPYNGNLMWAEGAFIIAAGKVFNLNSGEIRKTVGALSVNGTLNLNNDYGWDYDNSTVNIAGTVNVNAEWGIYSVNNGGNFNVLSTGVVHVNGGVIYVRGACSIAAGGQVEINSIGTFWGYFGTITNDGTIVNAAGCEFILGYANSLVNNGTLTNNGNFQKGSGTITGTGMINGSGSMAFNYTNPVGVTLSPGNSPGCTTVDGDFVNNGTLDIELADGTACTNFDQVQVINGHNATIGGIINITFPSGVPTTTTFTIITVNGAGTITDNSPTINWPAGYSGGGIVVGQSYEVSFMVLPVELVKFKASLTDAKMVSLDWTTASENNNAAFQVERSSDSRNWENIGTILGNGTSLERHDYNFMDKHPLHGHNYYRLKQEDFDGKYDFSKVVSVSLGTAEGNVHFQPNPTTGHTVLYVETNAIGNASLHIYNMVGNIVKEITISQESERQYHELSIDLPTGIYTSVLTMDGQQWIQRLVVE